MLVIAAVVAIAVSFMLAAVRTSARRDSINQALAVQQATDRQICAEVGVLNEIMTAQLRGALVRLNASVDHSDPVWKQQHALLEQGIAKLSKHKCKE